MKKRMVKLWKSFGIHSKKEWIEFMLNVSVGIIVLFVLDSFSNVETGQSIINKFYDNYIEHRMSWLANKKKITDSRNNIVFFDIDAESVTSLEHPYFFPRGIIAALIQYAADHQAKLVLVDMDFSVGDAPLYDRSDETKNYLKEVSGQAGDEMLVDVLAKLENDQNPENATKVLLPKESYVDRTTKNSFLQMLLGKRCDKVTNGGSFEYRNICWASPILYPSDADPYVRFWAPYVEINDAREQEEKTLLWSTSFLAAALYMDTSEDTLKNLEHFMQTGQLEPGQNNTFPWRPNEPIQPIKRSTDAVASDQENDIALQKNQRNRILFGFLPDNSPLLATSKHLENLQKVKKAVHRQIYHWRRENDNQKTMIPIPLPTNKGRNIGFLCWTDNWTDANEPERIENIIDCKDKIVIIGRSDEDGNDLFWTPVDRMAGMYVHGNAIATLLPDGEKELPHLCDPNWLLVWNVLFLVLFSWIAVKCPPWFVLILTIVMPLVLYCVFFIYFIQTNTFFYAGVACIGITLLDTVVRPLVGWCRNYIDIS